MEIKIFVNEADRGHFQPPIHGSIMPSPTKLLYGNEYT